jgi:hypothetical protein
VCRQAVETATGTLETDEAASRRVRHRAAGCEPCEAVECVSSRGLPWPRLRRVCEFIQHNLNQQLTLLKSPRPGSHEPLPFRATFQAACRRTPAPLRAGTAHRAGLGATPGAAVLNWRGLSVSGLSATQSLHDAVPTDDRHHAERVSVWNGALRGEL